MISTIAQPELSVFIEITFSDRKEMYAILRSLIADNINFPNGLSIEITPMANQDLFLRIHCNIGFETLLNTLDELLEHISVAQKVISHA